MDGDPIGTWSCGAVTAQERPDHATAPGRDVILLRDGAQQLQVLLVKRTPQARFMGGVWVFPGGAVDVDDRGRRRRASRGEALRGRRARVARGGRHRAPAPRRARRALALDHAGQVQIRFDTHFFLAALPSGQEPRVDGQECVDRWFSPAAALEQTTPRRSSSSFQTIKHLEQLDPLPSVQALLAHARGLDVQPVQPRIAFEGEVARVLLPGDPGYCSRRARGRRDGAPRQAAGPRSRA